MGGPHAALERFLERRDRSQLFARDTRDPDAPLFWLPDGEADRFKQDCRDGHLICPFPGCDRPKYKAVGGTSGRRHHFAHLSSSTDVEHNPERFFHLVGKEIIASWARRTVDYAEVEIEGRVESGQIADVLITSPRTGARVAVEVQYSDITFGAWKVRDDKYRAIGIVPVWLFGHIPEHLRHDPHEPGSVRDRNLFEQILESGRGPIRWLNPDTGQVATGISRLDVDALTAAGVDLGVQAPSHDRLALHLDELAECTLVRYGMRTPFDLRFAEGFATVRRERDRRARELAEQRRRVADEEARRAEEERRRAEHRRRREQEREAAKRREEAARLDRERRRQAELAPYTAVLRDRHRQIVKALPQVNSVPGLLSLPSDRTISILGPIWRSSFYVDVLHQKVGRLLSRAELFPTVRELLRYDDPKRVNAILAEWLHVLWRCGWLDFWSEDRFILGPVKVLRDCTTGEDDVEPQIRGAMAVTRIAPERYAAVDGKRGVKFTLDEAGRVLKEEHVAVAPARPKADMAAATRALIEAGERQRARARAEEARDIEARRYAGRVPDPSAVPDWVWARLPTDDGINDSGPLWHADLWVNYIAGWAGAYRPWQQLYTSAVMYNAIRRTAEAERAVLGFLQALKMRDVVDFDVPSGQRVPDEIFVLDAAGQHRQRHDAATSRNG